MLLTEKVKIKLNGRNIKYYEDLGYEIPRRKDKYYRLKVPKDAEIEVDVKDLPPKSHAIVSWSCDNDGCNEVITGRYENYVRYVKEDGKIYCQKCSNKLFGIEKRLDTILKNNKSLAQSIIDEFGFDFFNKVWNWEKNNELGINPYEILPNCTTEVWWNCLNKKHDTYLRSPHDSKYHNYRCPECSNDNKRGENSPCWKHDKTQEERENDRSSLEYKEFVKTVMRRDNYTCQITGRYSKKLVVHHINGFNWDKENRTNPDNGITLCEEIHKLFHSIYKSGNNTEEQFNDFLMKIELGEIDISNI